MEQGKSRSRLRWAGAMLLALTGAAGAADQYDFGGPLAGVKLPPFPT